MLCEFSALKKDLWERLIIVSVFRVLLLGLFYCESLLWLLGGRKGTECACAAFQRMF